MIEDNLSMTSIYEMEYNYGLINKEQLRLYVENQWLSKDGYKQILGEDYDTAQA